MMKGLAVGRMIKMMAQGIKMLVGMPDYDNYVQHMQERHPHQPIMSYKIFFQERQQARYAGGKGGGMRCC